MPIEASKEPDAFLEFERAGWDAAALGYDHAFGSVTRQLVDAMLDAAFVEAGTRLLDVCTGPGMLASGALHRGAMAHGIDVSGEVVDLARQLVPGADFQQADAQDLPFPDASFDAVTCCAGLMHVPDPRRVLLEMVRVLRPGGRVAVSAWDGSAPDSGLGIFYGAIKAHGNLDVRLPHGPDFFQFGSPDKLSSALSEVGLSDVEVTECTPTWDVVSAADLLDRVRNGAVRARAVLVAQTPEVMRRIEQDIEESLARLADQSGTPQVPMPIFVGSGSKH